MAKDRIIGELVIWHEDKSGKHLKALFAKNNFGLKLKDPNYNGEYYIFEKI
jgi:hypothetical protein